MGRECGTHMWHKKDIHSVYNKSWRDRTTYKIYMPTWEDNIKIDLEKIVYDSVNLIHVDRDRNQWQAFMNMVVNLQTHESRQFFSCWASSSCSRRTLLNLYIAMEDF
jgi:hypothetical protein